MADAPADATADAKDVAREAAGAAAREAAASGDMARRWPYPFWIAHRGAGKLAPENTLAAFRCGAAHGYRAFECDVKLSADGIPFLLHDANLQRTTSGQGAAADVSWSELSRLDAGGWHSRRYAGEPLPSLDAIGAFCIANGLALNIEIKPSPGLSRRTGQVAAEAAARIWRGAVAPMPMLSSFEPKALQAALETAPTLSRALLLDFLRDGWFEQAEALGCCAVVTNHRIMDQAVIARLHTSGMRALVYTVNEPSDAQRLRSLGVDGIITDAVDRFAPGFD